jgi:uncharacterized protein (DUF885 family)
MIQYLARVFALKLLPCLVLGLVSLATHADNKAGITETARLNAWLDARYEEELAFSPLQLTSLGRKTDYDQVDDFSEAAELEQYRWLEQTVVDMKREFDYNQLSPEGKISYDYWIYRQQLDRSALPNGRAYYSDQLAANTTTDLTAAEIHRIGLEAAVRSEIRRYLAWPGQATSYKMGMLKILELRENARQALADKFDIRGFHDAILGGGSLPLPIIEQRVNQWVATAIARNQPGQ